MTRTLLLAIVVAGVVGLGFGCLLKVGWEWNYAKAYAWERPPVVVNCYGKDFSKSQMVRAIEYWGIRGEKIGMYEHNPPLSLCERDHTYGFIIIRKSNDNVLPPPTLAATKCWTSVLEIKAAVIRFLPGSFNLLWINEHELGHALGYSHVKVDNHIMHPLYDKMGPDFWIP